MELCLPQARGSIAKTSALTASLREARVQPWSTAWHEPEAPALASWPLTKPPRLKQSPKLAFTYLDFTAGWLSHALQPHPLRRTEPHQDPRQAGVTTVCSILLRSQWGPQGLSMWVVSGVPQVSCS